MKPKVVEAKIIGFTQLLVHFKPRLQYSFTLRLHDLCKTGEAQTKISPANSDLRLAFGFIEGHIPSSACDGRLQQNEGVCTEKYGILKYDKLSLLGEA